ncbi:MULTISPECIES: hypothetical protein [Rodentibacter]|uniref:hypothetical protein n=1 Tax=Rodentibacter TaxID=1960084 RepID=UPI001CFF4A07|nr:hypothetical protein [Rodentibacter sp. JRC1]GJI56346.1 hypothetical protein HEMROJRC1_14580 [Rodentibacter sp. JRC1]
MNKSLLIILASSTLLSSCYYSKGCIYTPQMVNCYIDKGRVYPLIAGYQKQNTIGSTDSIQRWKDILMCGGTYGDINLKNYPTDYKIRGKHYKDLDECMEQKGYIYFHPAECGTQNPKWSTGKCNL